MTIEVFGHVKSLGFYGGNKVLVEVQIEASRMPSPRIGDPPVATFIADAAEVDMYRAGMGIAIQIRPHPYTSDAKGDARNEVSTGKG
jgi:hypothetical protein